MVADEHGLQLGGMMDGVGTVGNTINIERTYSLGTYYDFHSCVVLCFNTKCHESSSFCFLVGNLHFLLLCNSYKNSSCNRFGFPIGCTTKINESVALLCGRTQMIKYYSKKYLSVDCINLGQFFL